MDASFFTQLDTLSPIATSNKIEWEFPELDDVSPAAAAIRTLLLEPLFPPSAAWGSVKLEQGYIPPMGTIAIYGWLRHRGYNVDFLDTQLPDIDQSTVVEMLKQGQYDIVALPVFTPTAEYAYQTAKLVRAVLPDCKIILGGIHVTSLPSESMAECPECDFIIRHEAELAFDELISMLARGDQDWGDIEGLAWRDAKGNIVVNGQRPFIGELNQLPAGFYNDIDLTPYVPHPTQYVRLPNYPVMTQRGCPYKCSYCEASTILGKKTRYFSPERIIEELKILIHEKGARGVYFQDSTFTINKSWTMDLMELMVKENLDLLWCCNTRTDRVDPELLAAMREAGCRQIATGIESGNQQSLDIVQKGTKVEIQTQGAKWIREAKIRLIASFILCLPGEDDEMVQNTVDYAKSIGSHIAMFYLPVPYPGSQLYQTCKKMGGLRRTVKWSDFISLDFDDPVYVNPKIGKDGMRAWYKRAYREYYSHPKTWINNLSALQSKEDFSRLFRGARAVFSLVSHKPGAFIKSQYRGFHGQGAPYSDLM